MNMTLPLIVRGRPFDTTQRTKEIIEAVDDGNADAKLSFAEHVRDEGLLGTWYDNLALTTTIAQLIEHYLTTDDGRAELRAWAQQVAEDQYEAAISYQYEAA
ncbi:hypothetical protein [Litchfieldella xinjiangensis]|uniref:hypothetical protein n=1 Tax=Litchfieldella xinjiangensis TaxID=1166948 RepID=UPI0005B9301F|nr:hypothetical protein [Halomonas xinjiangensis]